MWAISDPTHNFLFLSFPILQLRWSSLKENLWHLIHSRERHLLCLLQQLEAGAEISAAALEQSVVLGLQSLTAIDFPCLWGLVHLTLATSVLLLGAKCHGFLENYPKIIIGL
jgi:hypothetical protein